MDWRRICFRSRAAPTQKEVGEIVLTGENKHVPDEIKKEVAELPQKDTKRWILYKDRTYAICELPKDKENCGVHVRKTAAKATEMLIQEGVANIVVSDSVHMPEWVAEGAVLASYQYDALYSKKKTQVQIVYAGENEKVKRAIITAEAQNFVRFLVDTPANLMTPTLFSEYAKEYLPENVEVKVHGKEELVRMNMHLLLGVASGSAQEPKLVELRYKGADRPPVALVGKGITFDSGGISIKPAAKMALMKGDMGGGAAVLGTIGALARMKAETHVVGIIPLTENMPSGTATKPGDVHVGCAGISVEVDNTDAEGRLILGDALHYARSFGPEKIVDIATLTGAIDVTFGPVMAGLFSNSDELADELVRVSNAAGDLVWRLPVTEEYKSLISSDVADLKNTGGRKGDRLQRRCF